VIPPAAAGPTGLDRDWCHALYFSPCMACGAGEETVPVRQSPKSFPAQPHSIISVQSKRSNRDSRSFLDDIKAVLWVQISLPEFIVPVRRHSASS